MQKQLRSHKLIVMPMMKKTTSKKIAQMKKASMMTERKMSSLKVRKLKVTNEAAWTFGADK